MSDSQAVRWGFCCAGKIANDFSIAMDKVTSESEGMDMVLIDQTTESG